MKDFEIQCFFVAEMVIDGGEVGARFEADLADGGIVKTDIGKNLTGGFKQYLTGAGVDGIGFFKAHDYGDGISVVSGMRLANEEILSIK